jgi:hypothetical protein
MLTFHALDGALGNLERARERQCRDAVLVLGDQADGLTPGDYTSAASCRWPPALMRTHSRQVWPPFQTSDLQALIGCSQRRPVARDRSVVRWVGRIPTVGERSEGLCPSCHNKDWQGTPVGPLTTVAHRCWAPRWESAMRVFRPPRSRTAGGGFERIAAGRVATEHRLRTSNALSVSETSSC